MSKSERLSAARRKKKADPGQQSKSGAAKPTYVKTDSPRKKKMKEEVILEKDKKGKGSGTKDACYHKVKSRYSVWPSAYASGALVKCRKVGAANWGNSTKKEGFTPSQIAALEHIGAVELNEKGQKCWKGYEKKGTKKMFGKTYNNCVKKEEVDVQASDSPVSEAATLPRQNGQVMRIFLTFRGKFFMTQMFFPSLSVPSKAEITDAVQKVYPDARVTQYTMTTPDPTQPLIRVAEESAPGKNDALDRRDQMIQRRQLILNRQKLQMQTKALRQQKKTDMHMQTEASAAWQRKEGKNKEGGLNEKGRKSYERENPGSDLKAPQPEGGPRKKSFCARMKGMKKKLTSSKTANDPDSRINKSLRKWKC